VGDLVLDTGAVRDVRERRCAAIDLAQREARAWCYRARRSYLADEAASRVVEEVYKYAPSLLLLGGEHGGLVRRFARQSAARTAASDRRRRSRETYDVAVANHGSCAVSLPRVGGNSASEFAVAALEYATCAARREAKIARAIADVLVDASAFYEFAGTRGMRVSLRAVALFFGLRPSDGSRVREVARQIRQSA